jgi:hypothetical protein
MKTRARPDVVVVVVVWMRVVPVCTCCGVIWSRVRPKMLRSLVVSIRPVPEMVIAEET